MNALSSSLSSARAAGEGPADVAAGHVQSEQGDPQRPRPGAAGRLQAHVAHRGACHRVPDPAADAGRRGAAVEGRPQPAFRHKGKQKREDLFMCLVFLLLNLTSFQKNLIYLSGLPRLPKTEPCDQCSVARKHLFHTPCCVDFYDIPATTHFYYLSK